MLALLSVIENEVPIGDISGYLIVKNDGIILFWNDDDMDFMVNCI